MADEESADDVTSATGPDPSAANLTNESAPNLFSA
jgi:hypothetical protein